LSGTRPKATERSKRSAAVSFRLLRQLDAGAPASADMSSLRRRIGRVAGMLALTLAVAVLPGYTGVSRRAGQRPSSTVCQHRQFKVGVWYQSYSGGPRTYRVDVYAYSVGECCTSEARRVLMTGGTGASRRILEAFTRRSTGPVATSQTRGGLCSRPDLVTAEPA
jgi:hypothetical protein